MSMQITTITALRTAIVAAIEARTPAEMAARRYYSVPQLDDVRGTGFRNFFVQVTNVRVVEDGIHGVGVECIADLDVHMNYFDMDETVDDGTIWSDGQELWVHLSRCCDPTIPGLMSVGHSGWRDQSTEPGQRSVAHMYEARFFARGLLAS